MNETGRMVIATNNPTDGVPLDVLQTVAQKAGLYGELSQTFERNIIDLLSVSQNKLLIVAHSQGTEVAGNVLGRIDPLIRDKIDYVPLGVATMAVPEGLGSYRGVVNPLDYVTQITGGTATYRANFYGKDNYSVETSIFTNTGDYGHGFDSYLQQDKVKELFKSFKSTTGK